MKMDVKYKPELIASADMARPQLQHAWLDVEHKQIIATEGHMLIVLPCAPYEGDTSGCVSSAALQEARKLHRRAGEVDIAIAETCHVKGGAQYPRAQEKFPEWRAVMPAFKRGDAGTVTFGLNARFLKQLADALGKKDGVVTLTVKIPEGAAQMLDPIIVGTDNKDEIAILMPAAV